MVAGDLAMIVAPRGQDSPRLGSEANDVPWFRIPKVSPWLERCQPIYTKLKNLKLLLEAELNEGLQMQNSKFIKKIIFLHFKKF